LLKILSIFISLNKFIINIYLTIYLIILIIYLNINIFYICLIKLKIVDFLEKREWLFLDGSPERPKLMYMVYDRV